MLRVSASERVCDVPDLLVGFLAHGVWYGNLISLPASIGSKVPLAPGQLFAAKIAPRVDWNTEF